MEVACVHVGGMWQACGREFGGEWQLLEAILLHANEFQIYPRLGARLVLKLSS